MEELIRRLCPSKWTAFELFITSLFVNILAFAMPLFVMQVLNRYVAYGVDATLATLIMGGILALSMELFLRQIRLRLIAAVCSKADQTLSNRVFFCLSTLTGASMSRIPSGWRQHAITSIEKIHQVYSASNMAMILDAPFSLLFIVALCFLSPGIALFCMLCLTITFMVSFIEAKVNRKLSNMLSSLGSTKQTLIHSTTLTGLETIRVFNAQPWITNTWGELTKKVRQLREKLHQHQGFLQAFTHAIAGFMTMGVISIGAIQVVSGSMTIGALIACNIIAARALMPVTRLIPLTEGILESQHSLKNLEHLESLPKTPRQGLKLKTFKGNLLIKDLSFQYDGAETPIIQSLNLSLKAGEVAVVIGANGSGKTTLARLLLGLLNPQKGCILVDGLDLRQALPSWWHKQVSYLPQEPEFLETTLLENIRMKNPDLSDSALQALIEQAGLHDFLKDPTRLQQKLTNNAQGFSLGVRKRFALARALSTDGHLIVFDEPTEGLDPTGRQCIYEILNNKCLEGRTLVIFSHDPKIIRGADYVVDLTHKPAPLIKQKEAQEAEQVAL